MGRSTGDSPDVVIVGAGIVGAACAYFLARAGVSVHLYERGHVASGSSGACEGNVLAWDKELSRELPLALRSAELWAALADELAERRGVLDFVRRYIEEEQMFEVQVKQVPEVSYVSRSRRVRVAELEPFIVDTIKELYTRLLRAFSERDWDELEAVLHPDFEEMYPQSGELIRGPANVRAIIESYPGGVEPMGVDRFIGGNDRYVATPVFSVLRVESSGNFFTGVGRARYPDGSEWHIIHIGQLKDGRIWRSQAFFAPSFDAPDWRAPYVEALTAD